MTRLSDIRARARAVGDAGSWEAVASEDRQHMSWVRDTSMPDGADTICLVGASDLETEQARAEFIANAPADEAYLLATIDALANALRVFTAATKDALAVNAAGFSLSGENVEAFRRADHDAIAVLRDAGLTT